MRIQKKKTLERRKPWEKYFAIYFFLKRWSLETKVALGSQPKYGEILPGYLTKRILHKCD